MSTMDPVAQKAAREELVADIEALRRQNVKSFAQTPSGFTVEFFPPEPQLAPGDKSAKAKDPDVCPCGHAEHAHMNGFCVEGCVAEQCNPEKKP